MSKHEERRMRRNAQSKLWADHDGEPWTGEELEWLWSWDGTEEYLAELSELLGRTIEACRWQFYQRHRRVRVTTTTTTTTTATWEVCPRCFLAHAVAQEECE